MLSIVSDTSARPSAGRSAVPAKMTSSIFVPRSARAPCAPSTHATESTMFDLPDPFGPTTTQTPGSNSSVVLSAKDLKPFSVSDLRNKKAPSPSADGRGRVPICRGPATARLITSQDAEPLVAGRRNFECRSTASTRARAGPDRHHAISRSTAGRGPSNSASTAPSPRLRTHPPSPSARACSRHESRKNTPWTRPVTTTRTRTGAGAHRARSDLTCLAEERRTVREAGPVHDATTARAGLAFAVVHLVVMLVLARAAEEVDVLLVGERRTAVLHRVLQRLEDGAVQPPDLLLRRARRSCGPI